MEVPLVFRSQSGIVSRGSLVSLRTSTCARAMGRARRMRPARRAASRAGPEEPLSHPWIERSVRIEGGARTVMAVSLNDLGTVLEETFAARSKWYYIGLKLGVEASELDAIKKDNPEAVKDCYLEALKCWLKGVVPKPTWAEALASDMVDEGGLAEKLREKYCPATDKRPNVGGEVLRVGANFMEVSCTHSIPLGQSRGLQREGAELRECLRQLQKFENTAQTEPLIREVVVAVVSAVYCLRPSHCDHREAIRKHASTCLSLGASIDHVTDQLQRLCRDELHISEGSIDKPSRTPLTSMLSCTLHSQRQPSLPNQPLPSFSLSSTKTRCTMQASAVLLYALVMLETTSSSSKTRSWFLVTP